LGHELVLFVSALKGISVLLKDADPMGPPFGHATGHDQDDARHLFLIERITAGHADFEADGAKPRVKPPKAAIDKRVKQPGPPARVLESVNLLG
jgi:hypothetical protein